MLDPTSALLRCIASHPGISQRALCKRLSMAERTARRHLTALGSQGLVIVGRAGRERTYTLADAAQPVGAPPPLTAAEVEALAVAALAARPVLAPTPLADVLDAAAEKLHAAWVGDLMTFEFEDEPERWDFDGATGGHAPPSSPALFRTLLYAIRNRYAVHADYFTASRSVLTEGRRLAPLGFLVRAGAWLVVARDLDAGGVKDFALAGFRAAECCEDKVHPEPDGFSLHEHARDRFGALAGETVERVRLLVAPEVVPYFQRKKYARSQHIEENWDEKGCARVTFEVEGMDALKAWVLSWGAKVRVLEPETLAKEVAEVHLAAAQQYDFSPRS